VILATATIGVYELLFLPTYAMQILGMPPQSTFGATMVVGLAGALLAPVTGLASDSYGRKPVFVSLAVLTLLLIVPGFLLLDHFRNAAALLSVALMLSAVHASGGAVAIMAIPEAMPPAVRSGANATVYALAIAIFGGTAQFNIAWLIKHTGDNLAPAYYWIGAALIGLIAMALFPETAPALLKRRAAK
jgi:MFS family permease